MKSELEIQPYIGVGGLRFGMTPTEVSEIVGHPDDVRTNLLGERAESWFDSGLGCTFSKAESGLVELGFPRRMTELSYKGYRLFSQPSKKIFKVMIELDGAPYEYLGFIVLLNLGITLTGFHDGDEEDKAVTVFAKRRWDETLEEMSRFDFDTTVLPV